MNQQPIVEKKIIHVNKQFGDLETNLKSSISYNLKDPIQLRKGDNIQLLKAMIGQRGLNSDTISFDENQFITLEGLLYIPANSRDLGKFGKTPSEIVEWYTTPKNISDNKDRETVSGVYPYDEARFGPTNVPVILYKIDKDHYQMTPVQVKKTVKIAAGNYTVQTLANDFTQQMTGQNINGDSMTDFVIEQGDRNYGFTGNFYDNEWLVSIPTYSNQSEGNDLYDFQDVITKTNKINGYAFVDLETHNFIVSYSKDNGVYLTPNDLTTHGQKPAFYYPKRLINQPQNPPASYTTGFVEDYIIGASEFSMTFDSEVSDRFAFANLHTPAKLQNFSDNSTANPNAGQQISKFNAMARDLPNSFEYGFYPYMCSSGVMITSFQAEFYKKESPLYNEIYNTYKSDPTSAAGITAYWKLVTYNTNQWWQDDIIPESKWLNCFWDRLGFSVEQLGNLTNLWRNWYTFGSHSYLQGFITYNDSNYSQATGSSGLGTGIVTQNGQNLQPYDCVGIFNQGDTPQGTADYQEFSLLCDSKYISAARFPDLTGGKNYYIVESDIIQNNYFDVTSNEKSIIGVLNFELSSNDTIYENQFEPFPVSQDRVLTQINIDLKNPDGTPVFEDILNENSGFFFLITRNVTPEMIEQEKVNKEIEKTKK